MVDPTDKDGVSDKYGLVKWGDLLLPILVLYHFNAATSCCGYIPHHRPALSQVYGSRTGVFVAVAMALHKSEDAYYLPEQHNYRAVYASSYADNVSR